ncbi:MAG: hypothetical protein AAGF79_14735 [Pseudomonadota bacterium]
MSDKTPFFVGYLAVPRSLLWVLWAVAGLLLAGSVGLAFAISTSQDDPGPGTVRFDLGRQTVTGIVELTPQPILHVTTGNERIAAGRTIMMSGPGKNGVFNRPAAKQGEVVIAAGVLLERGSLEMLQVAGGANGLKSQEQTADIPAPDDLGRWRLAGEICDGKCLAGAMRPGRGLAHKACANLCIVGGVPPVFVSTQPVEGVEFLMISGAEGQLFSDHIYDYMGQYIVVEGQVRRHGDLLVFDLEPETIEVLSP